MRVCFKTEMAGYTLQLEQTSRHRFKVTYGQQVKTRLAYNEAAAELGACIMHALACEGKLEGPER